MKGAYGESDVFAVNPSRDNLPLWNAPMSEYDTEAIRFNLCDKTAEEIERDRAYAQSCEEQAFRMGQDVEQIACGQLGCVLVLYPHH